MATHKKKNVKLLAYITVPVIFTIIGYALLGIALKPVWDVVSAGVSMFAAQEAPTFETELKSIYDPNAKPEPVEEPVEPIDETVHIPISEIELPSVGTQYGQITCDRIGLDTPAYWGDTNTILRYGAGQYTGSLLPGFGQMLLFCAHNTTFFNCFQDIEVGDVVNFSTNYGEFEYTVSKVEVYNEDVLGDYVSDHMRDEEEVLVMYTCYPFYAISGRKTDRLTVFCEKTAGPVVDWWEE
jgi:sortase A